ncbi:MAG: hydrogenase iron-sulfur subunit [bacterium]
MDKKIGLYICKGCDIGSSLDCDKLIEEHKSKVAVCKTHDTLCNDDGIKFIKDDIAGEGLNRVVIAACSNRYFPELFDFGHEVMTERVALREYVTYSHEPNDEDTQTLADDYINMGISKVTNTEIPEPHIEETSKDIMVVGGGMAGMTAAKAVADAGYKVHLVEKEAELGGWANKFSKAFPKQPPYEIPVEIGKDDLIKSVTSNDNITVHTSTVVKKTAGQPGLFDVTLQNGTQESLKVGSIILASGWKPYDTNKLGKWGYGVSPDVITNIELEDMYKKGEIKRPSNGKPVESIVFLQCAGSRDQDHLPYCSAVCCRVSLKQVKYVRENYPDAKIYVIYKDVRSPQQFEQFYAAVQNDEAVFFTKGELQSVTKEGDGQLKIDVSETLLGDDICIKADMVVLATGLVPSTKVEDAGVVAEPVEGEVVEEKPEEGKTEDGKKAAAGAEIGARILNLTYRQGTDLPTFKYGFPDSHFICFPYETRRTGIYAAGAVRAPMDFGSAMSDAYGAALKAIQAVESIARGVAVHPRSGDASFPDFFLQRCTQCKRCTEECPFGVLDEDEKGTPKPNPFRCRRCGICMGACPERIISFKDYSINMVSQIIKSISMPDEFDEKPRILVFICENDALPAVDISAMQHKKYNAMIRIIPLRCLGSMNTVWISDALASGFDGVILIGCKKGDDYQCHFVKGSELAAYRMDNVREKLKQLVLEEERVEVHELSITDYDKIPGIFDDFLEVMNTVGPNPYKDM